MSKQVLRCLQWTTCRSTGQRFVADDLAATQIDDRLVGAVQAGADPLGFRVGEWVGFHVRDRIPP